MFCLQESQLLLQEMPEGRLEKLPKKKPALKSASNHREPLKSWQRRRIENLRQMSAPTVVFKKLVYQFPRAAN